MVVLRSKTETVLNLAHSHPLARHLGAGNTIQRIRDRFHWPGLEAEVKRFCQACPDCQKTSPKPPPPMPLIPLAIIELPFERIGMDLVGPLPKSARGYEHILVVFDYATRYPEAILLRKATAKNIAHELFLLFSRVGIPTEILTDQGTLFMSRLMADLCQLLQVKQLRMTVYHPQTDGLIERFNQTLKQMLRRVAAEDRRDWDQMLPYVLFGIFSDVFSSVPGKTQLVRHDIKTPPGVIVKQRPYRIPEARRQAIEEEIQQMLKLGVIEPSRSPWSSPIVLVPKPDGTLHFCNDFRRLNEVSEFDGYPMPRVDELLECLGRAWYISTLDLTKGYWQVLLSDSAKPKTAFSTPSGHWQYRTLPFGLHRAPATFQRLMDIVPRPHQQYAAAELDDVVIHSECWEDNLDRMRRVLMELQRAGLAANPRKCHLALFEVKYLGFRVGRGLIKPQ